jgi:D-proline reductase (dithiol) PrdB
MPIPYIQRTRERYAAYPAYRWVVNTEAPWTPLAKPIAATRLALLTSGGFYLPDQPSFTDGDVSYRRIPTSTPLADLRIYHHGYRDDDPDRDPNCIFPLDRLRELAAAGVIGALVDPAFSFVMTYAAQRDIHERGPKLAAALRELGADAALLVPV